MTGERDAVAFGERVDAPYWAGLAAGELRLPRCPDCRRWNWPADWRCPGCGSFEQGWDTVDPVGRVFSWTRAHLPFVPAFADLVPYVSVLVELPAAGGARLLGHWDDTAEPTLGDAVRGTVRAPSERTLDLPVLTWGAT